MVSDIIGIPAFWLHALKNVDLFDDFIEVASAVRCVVCHACVCVCRSVMNPS